VFRIKPVGGSLPRPITILNAASVKRADPSMKEWASMSLAGLRILMVTHSYAPDLVGIAPYATETAEWLVEQGASVNVLTMPPYYPSWRVPAGTKRGYSKETLEGVTVYRIPTYVPAKPTLIRRLAFEGSWLAGAMPLALSRVVRSADVVIGVHPGLFASRYAAAIAGDRPLIHIVQDLVGQAADESGMKNAGRASRLLRRIEGRALRSAHAITVPTAGFIEPLAALGVDTSRVTVVPNWSRTGHATAAEPAPEGEVFRVIHAGNIGVKQGLELLEPSIRRAYESDPEVRFVFVGAGSAVEALHDAVGGLPNVDIHPHLPEGEFQRVLRTANAFLVHERPSVKTMSLPSKLTTYFAAGRPVLAVTSADSLTAAEIERSGGGIQVEPGSSDALISAIRTLRDRPTYAAELAISGMAYSKQSLERDRSLSAISDLVGAVR
jgi:glycosyltransferase involved in cell wall biosynthesis